MSVPTVFLSAASDDLEALRNILHGAFSRAGFRVFTQKHSLGAALGTLREYLVEHVEQSDCVIHLAGMAYGTDANQPFPEAPAFQCSWTQFEYYYAHAKGKKVIAFVCAPDLSRRDFEEKGKDEADIERKRRLQQQHRDRVASGDFKGSPLETSVSRTLNEQVDSSESLIQAVAAAVASVHGFAGTQAGEIAAAVGLHTLPPLPDGFVGREADLRELRALNPTAGAVLTGLRGMGGIGKTALALVLAHEWLPRFPDAQLFLDGRGTQDDPPSVAVLLGQVIQTFHSTAKLPDDEAALKRLYHDTLHGKRVLILLDNARDAAQAAPLIPVAGCALIVTSRQTFMLGAARPHHVGALSDAEATDLLREYHPFLTDGEAAELVQLCAGLPLALRLAGAHIALDAAERGGAPSVASYVATLRRGRLGALDADASDAGEVAISETLRLSEEQLPLADREAWRKLGVFTASFEASGAEAIAGANETLLSQFVRRSLLEREGLDRYKLHDIAADYARSRLGKDALSEVQTMHAAHFTKVGAVSDNLYLRGDVGGGLALFDRERAQIEIAFAWLAGRKDPEAAARLVDLVNAVVRTGQALRFHPRQQIAWLQRQLAASREIGDRRGEGNALNSLGLAYADLGDARKAIEYYEQRLTIAREIGDRRGEGAALGNLGNVYVGLGHARKAIEYHEQDLAIAGEIKNRRGEGGALGNLGHAHAALGDMRKAIECYERQLVIVREIGDRLGEGNALGSLGFALAYLGDTAKGIEHYEHWLAIAREIGDRRGEGSALWHTAGEYWGLENREEAIARAERALRIFEAIESPHVPLVRANLVKWKAG